MYNCVVNLNVTFRRDTSYQSGPSAMSALESPPKRDRVGGNEWHSRMAGAPAGNLKKELLGSLNLLSFK